MASSSCTTWHIIKIKNPFDLKGNMLRTFNIGQIPLRVSIYRQLDDPAIRKVIDSNLDFPSRIEK